jgi:8-amino-7-oxononanoate synthase
VHLQLILPQPFSKLSLTGKIAWDRFLPKQNRYLFGVALAPNQEGIQSYFEYLKHLKSTAAIDRRKLVRRKIQSNAQIDKREKDRRGHAPIFNKATKFINRRVKILKANNIYFYLRELETPSGSHIRVNGRNMLMFGSNNYLGLTNHPKVKEAAIKATREYGAGAGAVRLLGGTFKLHSQLEEKLAEFKGAESAIAYSSGYAANLTTVSTLVCEEDDLAFIDERDHASIIDGLRLSRAKMRVFKHNDMSDLREKLATAPISTNKIIIVDGVFSMDGDIVNLEEVYRLAKRYGATLMIDEAHATGVIGKTGRGTPEHFGLEGRVEVVMGTLSKALGGIGGFVAGSKVMIDYLKHAGRGFVFSSALPPAVCASVLAAIDVLNTEPEWIQRLHSNASLLRRGLQDLGFNTGLSATAIVPVIIGDEMRTYQMTRLLHDQGIFVSPVAFPAVKRGTSRLRASVMATHEPDDINKALEAFKKAGQELGVI